MKHGLNLTSIIDNLGGLHCPIDKEIIPVDCMIDNDDDFLDIDEDIEKSVFNKKTLVGDKVRDYLRSIGVKFEEKGDCISFPYRLSNQRAWL